MPAGFADKYLQKQHYNSTTVDLPVPKDLSIIVVIPCFNDIEITHTISSIYCCTPLPSVSIEIIVVINDGAATSSEIISVNNTTYNLLKKQTSFSAPNIQLIPIHISNIPNKKQGAGFARKIGMDLATEHFNTINKPEGIIVSLDADTLVSPNYFEAIANHFLIHPKSIGATIRFEHRLEGNLSTENYNAIALYEMHIRYYKQILEFIGFPYSYYTIGSAFCVKASTYVKEGGMNDKKAGEDFYFLQKIIPNGEFGEINDTCVYPSSRISDRVPFGTGPMLKQIIGDKQLETYSPRSFFDLKQLIDIIPDLYEPNSNACPNNLPKPLLAFLKEIDWDNIVSECRKNSASRDAFIKRLYKNFNAFRVVKYLNFYHNAPGTKVQIQDAVKQLLISLNIKIAPKITNPELLTLLRNREINNLG